MGSNIQEKTLSSLMWKFFERSGAQFIAFFISILLARLLTPDNYGTVALITVYISVAQVFVQGGFTNALIQKKDADDLDFSSVFYCSLVVSVILYLLIFLIAPYVALFYDIPELKDMLRVLSLTIIIGTYKSMQNTLLSKKLLFKKQFISSFGSIVVGGGIGVILAYRGFGAWALVAQQLFTTIMTSIILSFTIKWKPRLMFSFMRLKPLFSFGSKLLLSSILETVYQNIYTLIIGAKYSSSDLAFWNKSKQFPVFIVSNVNGTISPVMYPVMVRYQDNKKELKNIVRRSINTSAYIMFPLMMGLAICAEPIVRLLLTDKWLPCVPFLQAWCFIEVWKPIHTANLQAYKAMGRSDIFLRLEIIKKIIGLTTLSITLSFGLEIMMLGLLITTIIFCIVNTYPNIKLLNYGYIAQMKDIFPSLAMSVVMGGAVWLITFFNLPTVFCLIVQVTVGIVVYVALSIIFKIEMFHYLLNILLNFLSKKKKDNNKK